MFGKQADVILEATMKSTSTHFIRPLRLTTHPIITISNLPCYSILPIHYISCLLVLPLCMVQIYNDKRNSLIKLEEKPTYYHKES